MSVLYLLVAFSLLVALAFLGAFLWALRDGQYEDTHTPAMRVLFEENKTTKPHSNEEVAS